MYHQQLWMLIFDRGILFMQAIVMQIVSYCALACATLVANRNCPFIFHQEKEPDVVRKLRKF